MRWTVKDIRYLEEHAQDGAEAVASSLGRSVESVRQQAKNYGISLRKRWLCPNCGREVFRPLNVKTGWCSVCTKAAKRVEYEQQMAKMLEEVARDKEEDRKRQAAYSRMNRVKKRCGLGKKSHVYDTSAPEQGKRGNEGGNGT